MNKPFIVAEMSCNHLGYISRAIDIIDAAVKAGADAVKIQFYDQMVVDRTWIIPDGPWKGMSLARLYERYQIPHKWLHTLFSRAADKEIVLFASVFDTKSLHILEGLGCPMYKISSFELVDLPLIRAVTQTGKPMVLSTGMASEKEINDAVIACLPHTPTLLHCVSAYPTEHKEANLQRFKSIGDFFLCETGLSDHSLGIGVSVAAVALGATLIEKHLTLSRADGGPDSAFSMEPQEFKTLVEECRNAYQAIQPPLNDHVEAPQRLIRRSLWFSKGIPAGGVIRPECVVTASPADGLPPSQLVRVIGNHTTRMVKAGEPVTEDILLTKKTPLSGG